VENVTGQLSPIGRENPVPAKFVLKKTANGQFHFMLLATNGRVVASSEMYKTKAAALNGIESIRKNAGGAVFEDKSSSKG
jgi:uncharacterized protein YegP (UPF0339 family)